MSKNLTNPDAMRKKAGTAFTHKRRTPARKKLVKIPRADTAVHSLEKALRELEIHQADLKKQNDELRRAQAILQASQKHYVEFYDFALVGYITLASDGRLDGINLTGASMLGEERNNLLHRNFVNFVFPEDRDLWNQHFASVLQHDTKFTCELAVLRKDGICLHVQLDSLRLRKSGESDVIRVAMTDITELIRAEEAIREQEEFFRMIAENIDDFVAVIDLDGRRLYNSPSYAKLFNNVEKMKGTDSFAEIHPDDREYVKRVFQETVKSGTGLQVEYRFVLTDGRIYHMESHGTLIRNKLGQPSRVIVVSHDITARKQIDENIRNLAYFDALTCLPNRRMLHDRMSQAMASSNRNGNYCALMFLDLDNFKPLNDLYGHAVGDTLLVEVAQRISSCVREMDTVARFGGDEFVVMLCDLDVDREASIEQARIVAEKIRTVIDKPYVLKIKGKENAETEYEHHCTASIGVAMFINHENSPEDLLKQADIEMYQAKRRGRNQVCFLNP